MATEEEQTIADDEHLSQDSNEQQQQKEEDEEDDDIVVVDAIPVRTTIRRAVTPHLPPPVVVALDRVDLLLEPHVGQEPSVTIGGTVLLGILLFWIVKWLSHVTSGKALQDNEDDDEDDERHTLQVDKEFTDTVLLCGPSFAGKTRLFYELCHGRSDVSTLTSLRMNVDVSNDKIRFMDYPGHRMNVAALLESLWKEQNLLHVVLVLDATQNVAPAADILYQLLQAAHHHSKQKNYSSGGGSSNLSIFCACHKSDLPNAKNWRRIKIQLRTELERLLKLASSSSSSTPSTSNRTEQKTEDDLWWPPGKPLDLDHIATCLAHLEFGSVSCETKAGMTELQAFCKGKVPEIQQI